jgi:hypothetical protein
MLLRAAEYAVSAFAIVLAVFVVPVTNDEGSPFELKDAAIALVIWLTFAVPIDGAKL